MFIFYSLSLVMCFHGIYGLTASPGKCPEVEPVEDLNVDKLMGKWYEWSRSLPNFDEAGFDCVTFNITKDPDNKDYLLLKKRMFSNETRVESQIMLSVGIDYDNCPNNRTCGRVNVSELKADGTQELSQAIIVDVQYSAYHVVMSCKDLEGENHLKTIWILGRRPHPGESVIKALQKTIKESNGNSVQYEMTNQHPYCSEIYHDQQSER